MLVRDYIRALQNSGVQRPEELQEDESCAVWLYESKVLSGDNVQELLITTPVHISIYLRQLHACGVRRPALLLAGNGREESQSELVHVVRQLERAILRGSKATFLHLHETISSDTAYWLQKQAFQVRYYNTLQGPLTTISWTPPHYFSEAL